MSIFKRNQDPPYNVKSMSGGGSSVAGSSLDVNVRPAVTTAPAAQPASTAEPAHATSPGAPSGATAGPPDPRQVAAVLDRKTEITGTLHSEGNVLVEGVFHGEIAARDTVWVEQGAQSHGQLRANDVVISGTVDGEIACERRLQIAASAVVTGEIRTPVLVIDEGATINCRFNMEPAGRKTQ